ncbi:Cytochrome p450 [Thalictrum thalictroides]|uniref:Cytochrome p450 n=1 Tax=Thalictrum thalictroides TaxID=46969 RepID=A0A7J6URU9_THATH|nr:Cytochrome p450 [Thalictrum thalictroides]
MASMEFLYNPFFVVTTVITVLILQYTVKIFILRSSKTTTYKKRYHPIAGTIFDQLLNFSRLHHYMTDLATKYKSYRLLSPFRNELFTTEPANIEYILKTNFANYGKGLYNYTLLKDLLGDGIFTVDGDKWRYQRKIASYEFSTKVLRDFSSSVFRKNAANLAHIISQAATSNHVIDIQDLLMKSTMDSIFEVGFGVKLETLSGLKEEGASFTKAFDDCSALTLWRYVDISWKIKKFFNIGSEAVIRKNLSIIDNFVYKIIHTKIKQLSESRDMALEEKEDILSRFLKVDESDPKFLRDIILSFLLAGKDTTAVAVSWFLYMLCKHPHIQEKIVEEVREATKTNDNTPFDDFIASIDDKALDKMQYLLAALMETLRLYPPLPVDAKICFSDDTLPDGFSMNKGDIISYQIYAMGRMKFLWGDNAEEFRPERWLDDDGVFQHQSPFKFTAFQAGPRICLGKEFANRQMKIFSALLVGCFLFKLGDEKKIVNYRTMMTLQIDGGLHLRAFHRLKI